METWAIVAFPQRNSLEKEFTEVIYRIRVLKNSKKISTLRRENVTVMEGEVIVPYKPSFCNERGLLQE